MLDPPSNELMMFSRLLHQQRKGTWTRGIDALSCNLDLCLLGVTGAFMLGSFGELRVTGMVVLQVSHSYQVFFSCDRSTGGKGPFASWDPSPLLCSCVQRCCSSMTFPVQGRGWQLLCSTKSQDSLACWVVQMRIPHRKHSFSFLFSFFCCFPSSVRCRVLFLTST